MGGLQKILESINKNFESTHLPRIQKFMSQPSVSATGEGILETAQYLMEELQELGATEIRLVPIPKGGFGHPQIYAEMVVDPAQPTILLYSMYDVQPVNPEEWVIEGKQIDPFGGEIHPYEWISGYRGRCLIGRGAINTKGPTEAFFNVIRTFREEKEKLPINFIYVIEGEEELGSIHMGPFIKQHKEALQRTDFVYFPFFAERYDGVVTFFLGVKGIIPTRVRLDGGEWGGPAERDIHSMSSGVVQSPVFKLVQLLHSLKNDDTGEILVPGVMEDPDIAGPDNDDKLLLEDLAQNTNWDELKRSFGVKSFRTINDRELTGVDYFLEELFKPGLSINGINGGYVGDGMKTIIPQSIAANLDIRLAPFQKPEKICSLYEKHIRQNFPMAQITFGHGYPTAKVSVRNPFVAAMIQAMRDCGKKVTPTPLVAGSAPFALFQAQLGLPFVLGGLGHGGRQHSANEYAVLDSDDGQVGGIRDYELCLARFLFNAGETGKA